MKPQVAEFGVPYIVNETDADLVRIKIHDPGNPELNGASGQNLRILVVSGRFGSKEIPIEGSAPSNTATYTLELGNGHKLRHTADGTYRTGHESKPLALTGPEAGKYALIEHTLEDGHRVISLLDAGKNGIKPAPAFLQRAVHAQATGIQPGDTKKWMEKLPGHLWISHISVPGTHETCARHGTPWHICQNESLKEQLNAGIRFLDIRCRHFNKAFTIHHREKYQELDFSAVQTTCVDFLNANPNEAIVMLINEEWNPDNNGDESFEDRFWEYQKEHPQHWYLEDGTPKLGQIRGRIVLIRRFKRGNGPGHTNTQSKKLGVDATGWPDDKTGDIQRAAVRLRVQDAYQVASLCTVKNKWGQVRDLLNDSQQNPDAFWFINYASGAQGATPETIANGCGGTTGINQYLRSWLSGFPGTVMLDYEDFDNHFLVNQLILWNYPITGFSTLKLARQYEFLLQEGDFLKAPQGHFLNRVDTNTGTRGEIIHIADIHDPKGQPVTSINVVASDRARTGPTSGWQWNPQNLSEGAGGKFTYLEWKVGEKDKPPVRDIWLDVTRNNSPKQKGGWVAVQQDLNQGASDLRIFLYYRITD